MIHEAVRLDAENAKFSYIIASFIPSIKFLLYRNDPKFSDTQNICFNHSKV